MVQTRRMKAGSVPPNTMVNVPKQATSNKGLVKSGNKKKFCSKEGSKVQARKKGTKLQTCRK